MGDLIRFDFRGHDVRQVGTFDAPEWVAKDVCDVLGITWSGATLRDFPENERGCYTVTTPGGRQEMATILEPGFYRLVSKSRKPDARAFQSFVFGEVLPSLRKHGCYPPPTALVAATSSTLETQVTAYLGRLTEVMEAMGRHVNTFAGRVDTVEESVVSLRGDIGQLKRQFDVFQANQLQSKRFSMPRMVFDAHRLFLIGSVAYSGRCPCCGENPLFKDGHFSGEREHATGTGNVTVEQTWLVCKDCNQGVLKTHRTGEGQRAFELYQDRLTKWRKGHYDLAQLALFRISGN